VPLVRPRDFRHPAPPDARQAARRAQGRYGDDQTLESHRDRQRGAGARAKRMHVHDAAGQSARDHTLENGGRHVEGLITLYKH
jgi:hypothetical protein